MAQYDEPPPAYDWIPPTLGDETFEQKFSVQKPKFNDVWAAILFFINLAGFIYVAVIGISAYVGTAGSQGSGIYTNSNTLTFNTNTLIGFFIVIGVTGLLAGLYFYMAFLFTKQFIYISGLMNVILGIGVGVYYLYMRYYSAGIVFIIFAIFFLFIFLSWRRRIPLAVLLFQAVMSVARRFPSVYVVGFIGTVLAVCFSVVFALTLVGVFVKYSPTINNPSCAEGGSSCSSATVIGLTVFVTFSAYWISEVLKNLVHTTVAGVYGAVYYSEGDHGLPKHACISSFRRAATYSFGSICLGSLLVAIVQLLRQFAAIGETSSARDGDCLAFMCFCIMRCFISMLEWAILYFNHYAYAEIALFGKKYIQAAKDCWKVIKNRGIDALINDCLIDTVLTMGALAIAFASALVAYLYLIITSPSYNSDGSFTWVFVLFGFLIGLQVTNVACVPIKSGTATLFVALAEDPVAMSRTNPQLYRELVKVYPKIQYGVNQ